MKTNCFSKHEAETVQGASQPGALENRRLKVLVIDDSIPLLRVLSEGLEEFGHTTVGAQSGPEALALLEKTHVDVVICDLGMPDMNGWDVGKAVQDSFNQGRTSTKIPFILLTGWASRLTPEESRPECGVDAILEKPIDLMKLVKVVNELAAK